MKKFLLLLIAMFPCLFSCTLCENGPEWSFEWTGSAIVPDSEFLDASRWTKNQADFGQGDAIDLASDAGSLRIDWTLGGGDRTKWVQCYLPLNPPVSFGNNDIVGLDFKGCDTAGPVGFELKFEDGVNQAVWRWDNLAGLNRWCEKIVVLKKQFANAGSVNWENISVLSLAVYATTSGAYSGSVHVKNLIFSDIDGWNRADRREAVIADFAQIKKHAMEAIRNRQAGTGLLVTWTEDDSSWLYGQGLALKALCSEGTWSGAVPSNASAQAAESLALFLAENQLSGGYWPRTWNAITGAIVNEVQADGTIWMGDFPWPVIGLQCYYKKTADARVAAAVGKGLAFLKTLIGADGKLSTLNTFTLEYPEVTSCEAYAAVLLCLYESNENALAGKVLDYITGKGWDGELRIWKEAVNSSRPVLFANTWMAPFLYAKGDRQAALDSLSVIGRILYTAGPGSPHGLDGIGPLAVWYEGTLSYICAKGPGSYRLLSNLIPYINPDGTVPHYNDNFGIRGGVWAVDWHALDGTSWLYFAAAKISPFDVFTGQPVPQGR